MHPARTVNPLLHDIRSFLETHEHPVPPWSPAHTPLAALYRLLRQRQGDDALWNDLAALTRTVAASRRHTDGALTHADVDDLLAELRHTLGENRAPVPLRRWAATAPLAALSGFLLLGAAMGCSTPASDDDDDSSFQQNICTAAIQHEIPTAEDSMMSTI